MSQAPAVMEVENTVDGLSVVGRILAKKDSNTVQSVVLNISRQDAPAQTIAISSIGKVIVAQPIGYSAVLTVEQAKMIAEGSSDSTVYILPRLTSAYRPDVISNLVQTAGDAIGNTRKLATSAANGGSLAGRGAIPVTAKGVSQRTSVTQNPGITTFTEPAAKMLANNESAANVTDQEQVTTNNNDFRQPKQR